MQSNQFPSVYLNALMRTKNGTSLKPLRDFLELDKGGQQQQPTSLILPSSTTASNLNSPMLDSISAYPTAENSEMHTGGKGT